MRKSFVVTPLLLVLVGTSQLALALTNCPLTIAGSGTQVLQDDYQQTSSGDCITITVNNVTLDINNKEIICNNASGCHAAINFGSSSGSTVKNGYVVSGTGNWTLGVINGTTSVGGANVANANTVQRLSVNNAQFGVLQPSIVKNSIFANGQFCVFDYYANSANGSIDSNYCFSNRSPNYAFVIYGPASSGSAPTVQNNYVWSNASGANGSAVDVSGGYVTLRNNIIDGGGDINTIAQTTHSGNICPDSASCPDGAPGGNFHTQPSFSMSLSSN